MAAGPTARYGWRTWRSLLKLCGEQELGAKLLQSLAAIEEISSVGAWLGWRCRKLEFDSAYF